MKKDYVNNDSKLMQEWDFDKNNDLNLFPDKITLGSDKKVWWKCQKCHYSWFASIGHRSRGRGCPKCANESRMKSRILHYGSLLEDNPELCKEWNYEKNNNLKPEHFLPGSGQLVWWKCSRCGHEWKTTISNRNSKSNKTNCPKCSLVYQSSIAEKFVYFYIRKLFPDAQENVKLQFLSNRELDIYIPSIKVGIEYDGGSWHNDISADEDKDTLCNKNGIFLIRIREKSCPKFKNSSFIIWSEKPKNSYIKLNDPIKNCLNFLSKKYNKPYNFNINVEHDYDNVLGSIKNLVVQNSIKNTNLIEEWDYELNSIDPSSVSTNSNKKVWWKCKTCNNSWRVSVNNRSQGNGCPYCAHKIIKQGYNDLETTHPEILEEWDYEKNTIKPNTIFAGSNKKVWWKCKKHNHSWESSPNSRINQHSGCPYCSNNKILTGFNDLYSQNQELMKEWDFSKNIVDPKTIAPGSNKKVWWKCSICGFEWQTSPNSRTSAIKTGCPKCAAKHVGNINKHKRSKKVRCVETNVVYSSSKEASIKTNISQSSIAKACRGEQKFVGNFHWEYLDK